MAFSGRAVHVSLALPLLLTLGVHPATSRAAPTLSPQAQACQRQVGREGQKFKKAKLRAWEKCLDSILLGKPCDAAKRDAAITKAETVYTTNVAKKCTPPLLFGAPPAGIGFAPSCDLEPGALEPAEAQCRALPANDPASLTRCLICWKQAELHELLQILYPCLAAQVPAGSDLDCVTPPASCPSPTDKAGILCLRASAKAGIDFFLVKEKALEQCLDAVRKGTIPGPCPDKLAQAKIAAAEKRKVAQMKTCTRLPPWWGFCPEACKLPIAAVADITTCIDRSAEEIADEVVCQQYPGAAVDGIACPKPDPPTCDSFPPAGDDTFSSLAVVSVRIPFLGLEDSVQLTGPTTIHRSSPMDPGDGRRVIDTEMLSLDLVGTSSILGPLHLMQSPVMPSKGMIKAQAAGMDFLADSFFDVFFEVETTLAPPFDRLRNPMPIRMQSVISCIPPLGNIYIPAFTEELPLVNAAGDVVAFLTHARHGVVSPFCGNGIVEPFEECDDGNTVDCDGCDSNCKRTGCGNGIVCKPEECEPPGKPDPSCGVAGVCNSDCRCTVPPPTCHDFPPAGFDTFPSLAVVSVSIPSLSLSESYQLTGPTTIHRGDPMDPGDGRREIDTEMISLALTGTSPTIGPLILVQNAMMPSKGKIKAQTMGMDFPADSFFDVFFEVDTTLAPPFDRLHNANPIHMQSVITCIPPFGSFYLPAFTEELPLLDAQNNVVAFLTHARHGVTSPFCGNDIVEPFEQCDDGNTIDCDGCDSNCTKTGCGNSIVCEPEQCDPPGLQGDCRTGQVCNADCNCTAAVDCASFDVGCAGTSPLVGGCSQTGGLCVWNGTGCQCMPPNNACVAGADQCVGVRLCQRSDEACDTRTCTCFVGCVGLEAPCFFDAECCSNHCSATAARCVP